jgi:hypothetical protein
MSIKKRKSITLKYYCMDWDDNILHMNTKIVMEKLENDNIIIKEGYTKNTKIGINADISGFGKTLSMLGLIARDKMNWDIELPYVFETIISEAKSRIKNYFVS